MMTFRRYLKMAALVAATVTMTACGGGGDTGPQWAQDLKAEVGRKSFAPGTYLSTCVVIPFVAGSNALQESDLVTYEFVETTEGANLYVTHTLYSTLDCADTGTSKQAEIRFPVSSILKAGPTKVTGVELADDQVTTVIGEENMPGEKILLFQSSGNVQITVFNGATLTDGNDPDLGALKVITSSLGNVLFNNPPLVDESVAKDVVVLRDNLLYLGIQENNDEAYDSDGYPLYVDLGLPLTRQ